LVTTSTASPLAGSADGVNVYAATVCVPGAANFTVAGADAWPLPSAQ
jgi:hypothetical protein